MSLSFRNVLVQRLDDLGEFKERLHDSSMTQYKRKQAREAEMPPAFVRERREELRSKWYVHALMLLAIATVPPYVVADLVGYRMETFAGVFSDPSGLVIAMIVGALGVFFIGGAYRIRGLVNYARRREVYTLLHELDQLNERAEVTAAGPSNGPTSGSASDGDLHHESSGAAPVGA